MIFTLTTHLLVKASEYLDVMLMVVSVRVDIIVVSVE